ncbi:hypothetical protein Zm00014a_018463 [Zea mays]|uniref:Uncharacterized protein n=1 Tax=Zea mays TaxID=4577 RepID=A0A3L6DZV9_MAIZE|nr:hypothetical protein Zm00014a_018463 [Zea mays]
MHTKVLIFMMRNKHHDVDHGKYFHEELI